MNDTIKAIKNRRSVRQYKKEQIKDEELREILDCAIHAPNARNQQKWHFTVIQDAKLMDNMVAAIKEYILAECDDFLKGRANTPGYHTFHHAPTVVMITAEKGVDLTQFDCATATQSMAVAAESVNIGSCVIASSGLAFSTKKADEFRKALGIPAGYEHICCLALGYKAAQPDMPPRNTNVINYVR